MSQAIQLRTYNRRDSAVFLKTAEKWGGLSNMAGGFSLWVNRVPIPTSEHLYQACRFPHMPDVQKVIIEQASPMTAKMKSKPFRSQSRHDWDDVRVRIMRWCLRVKLAQNWQKFANLLIETGERPIVEESRKDDFWGAKPQDDGTLVGCNVLGRLLMELREELKRPTAEALRRVEPIPLHDFTLYGRPILAVEPRNVVITQPDPDLVPTPDSLWSQPPESIEASAEVAADEAPSEPLIVEVKPDEERPEPQKQEDARSMTPYPKRLIEVDLPIARISAHSRREKAIRHGHISTLHIWWARRPLAACRAVILASLWPDPVDLAEWAKEADAKGEVRAPKDENLKPGEGVVIRPKRFLDEARQRMTKWSQIALGKASKESYKLLVQVSKNPKLLDDPATLRTALLDFIADFADWDHSTDKDYVDTSRALVQAAHESLGGEAGTRPMVIDPFAGGGSIPLEALRVGADAFASDLNPIPVLLNKVVLEYIPKYGQRLADEVRRWGQWVKEQAEKELAKFYPKDKDGSTPIAYLWARTVLSEAPGEGTIPVEVPLMRSLWLAKKAGHKRALRWVRDDKGKVKTQTIEVAYNIDGKPTPTRVKRPVLEIFEPKKESEVEGGTVARGNATCPVTGYTTKVDSVRSQLKKRRGGASDARLFAVVTTRPSEQGRFYRLPTRADEEAFAAAATEIARRANNPNESSMGAISVIPDEPTPLGGGRGAGRAFSQRNYGMDHFADLFTPRQLLALTTLSRLVREVGQRMHMGYQATGLPSPNSQFVSPPARLSNGVARSGVAKRIIEAAEALFVRDDAESALLPLCAAIDQLARETYGSPGKATYKQFIHDRMELITRATFRTGILNLNVALPALKDEHGKVIKPESIGPNGETLYSFQQVVYHVIRCGLAHQCAVGPTVRDCGRDKCELRVGDDAVYLPLVQLALGLFLAVLGAFKHRDELRESVLEVKALNGVPLIDCAGDTARLLRLARHEAPASPSSAESSPTSHGDESFAAADEGALFDAVQACLALVVNRLADRGSTLTRWDCTTTKIASGFSRQAIPVVWDFAEVAPFGEGAGDFGHMHEGVVEVCEVQSAVGQPGSVAAASAAAHPLPDDAAAGFITDPPYYDAVPYSDLSDYFYVWLKRSLPPSLSPAFTEALTPKLDECIVDDAKGKDQAYFESMMTKAMAEGRRVTQPSGVGVVVFAHKSTSGWEAQLKGMIEAGWVVTGSWPIDTEMGNRLRAMDSAALASSVHLVVRPRENTNGSLATAEVGEWREVLAELPKRIDEWMPRLADEGVVGADAIFACLGPALEIFSRYSRVEKASGEAVSLREYLEYVWAAVSSEALSMIFKDADAQGGAGLEPDARLTAMWLWTLGGGKKQANGDAEVEDEAEGEDDEEDDGKKGGKARGAGFVLEFDAARKIAQGLGIHLEKSESIVEVKGESARLLPVAERTGYLFGKEAEQPTSATAKGKKKKAEATLFQTEEDIKAEIVKAEAESAGKLAASKAGATVLDRVHQSMLLFAAGRGEALKRFLVEDGVGKDGRFWKLAQSLSALYPTGTDEKRWVDGVLARKKGLGF